MNSNGFFSAYALIWLNIVTAAAMLIVASAAALLNAKQNMLLYDAQIVSVYRTKERLKQMKRCLIDEEQKADNNEEEKEADCISKPEIYMYKGIVIHVEYEKEGCHIWLNDKQLLLSYDIHDLSITDLVYTDHK